MSGQVLSFHLPFEVDGDGFPVYGEICARGLFCGAIIADLNKERADFFSAAFGLHRNSLLRMYVYDGSLVSFGVFIVGLGSISAQVDRYSSFNMIFECSYEGNYLFISDDSQRIVFAGSREFVDKCMLLVDDPFSEAGRVFESSFFDESEVSERLAFLRNYNGDRF